jgi:Protein of unknown function (DUF3343)
VTTANVVLVFPSNAGTMIATKTLRDSGVSSKMMPTPRGVESAANLCLSVEEALETKALAALKAANVAISAVFR